MKAKSIGTFVVCLFTLGILTFTVMGVAGRPWSSYDPKHLVGISMAVLLASFILSFGILELKEADEEDNTKAGGVHYVKLTSAILLIIGTSILVGAYLLPIGFFTTLQSIVSIYEDNSQQIQNPAQQLASPLINVNGSVDPATIKAADLDAVTILGDSLPAQDGRVHVTVVLDKKGKEDLKLLVPKARAQRRGQVWFEFDDNNKSVQSPFAAY